MAKVIINAKIAEVANTVQFTSTGDRTIIETFTVTNTGSDNALISVYLLNPGDSPDSSNKIVNNDSFSPGDSRKLSVLSLHAIESGGSIATEASLANTLTIRATGR